MTRFLYQENIDLPYQESLSKSSLAKKKNKLLPWLIVVYLHTVFVNYEH